MHEIFVSYSHDNQDWIEALDLDKALDGLEQATFWIDKNRIHPSDKWNDKAKEALNRATSVVLLVSEQFLNSPSIAKHELPEIARRYKKGEISIVFVPIGQVETEEIGKKIGINNVHNIVSIPPWKDPLPIVAERRKDIREKIISAAAETPEVQNLRRNIHRKYLLTDHLGDGTLGRVFIAKDSQLEREVAVKLLRCKKCNRQFRESVKTIAGATDHTNILTVHGAYLDSDPPHFIRQYVAGYSLRTFLAENHGGPVNINWVQGLLKAIGAAINHAHNKQVSNLNIKPSNIIMANPKSDSSRRYYLSLSSYRAQDFLEDEDWRTDLKRKDVLFLPTECRQNCALMNDYDAKKADQYRLGLVAYEMLVGSKRFEQLAAPLRWRDFNPRGWRWPELATECKGCPEHVGIVVDRMVKVDPRERYESIDAAILEIQTDLNVEIARDSYSRLMSTEDKQTDFFRSFYVKFLNDYPKVQESFFKRFGDLIDDREPNQDWQHQFQALKEAVLLLVVFCALREDKREPNILTRIVNSHIRKGIPAILYKCFSEVLVETVLKKDTKAPLEQPQLRRAWTYVIKPGIEYMEQKTKGFELSRWRQRETGQR